MIVPGERLLALYLNVNGNHKLVINELFPQEKDLGVDLVWYNDIQDGVEILSQYVEKDKTIGIDKIWPAKFLLRVQELEAGSRFVNGSMIVDSVSYTQLDVYKRQVYYGKDCRRGQDVRHCGE